MFINKLFLISRANISKSKSFFNMKSSTYYFHLKTKILGDFQICISVPLNYPVTLIYPVSSFKWNFIQMQPLGAFCKKGVLKSFAKLSGKHLSWSGLFRKVACLSSRRHVCNVIKKETPTQVFFWEFFRNISEHLSHTTPAVTASGGSFKSNFILSL